MLLVHERGRYLVNATRFEGECEGRIVVHVSCNSEYQYYSLVLILFNVM